MNTDPNAQNRQPDLARAASDPSTDLEVLRRLAYEYPNLRPAIALNPATYEGLLTWLADLDDEAVNTALRRRRESGPVYPQAAAFGAGAGAGSAGLAGGAGSTGGAGGAQSEPKNGSNKTLLTVLIILLVVAVPLAFVVGSMVVGSPDSGESTETTATEDPQETAVPVETPSAEASETTEPTEETEEERYPAPDGAATYARVAAPSGNILCDLKGDTVSCTVLKTGDDPMGGACSDGSMTVSANGEEAGRDCSFKVGNDGMQALDYGKTAQNDHVACTSLKQGMSCWNKVSGQGFAVARDGWTTSDKGGLAEADYPWLQ